MSKIWNTRKFELYLLAIAFLKVANNADGEKLIAEDAECKNL